MLATATLSLALALTLMLPPVHVPLGGAVMLTVGGVVSPPPPPVELLTVTVTLALADRPAPSITVRFSVWLPLATPVVVQA
jgi:hypothetical protein